MKLIVGLGNPGSEYAGTRHNIGQSAVRALAKQHKAAFFRDKECCSLSGKIRIGGHVVVLALPLTYMNLSGGAVSALVRKYKIELNDLLLVCDDLDLELGRIKIKPGGSSGGQRGLKSIIAALGTQDICRLRLGIGRPKPGEDPADFVLEQFTRNEKEQVLQAIEDAMDCCDIWAVKGVTESMNMFNLLKERK